MTMANYLILDFLGAFIDSHTIFKNLQVSDENSPESTLCLSLPELLAQSGYKNKSHALKQLNRLIKDKPLAFKPFTPLVDSLRILKQAGFRLGLLAPKLQIQAEAICKEYRVDFFDFIESETGFFTKEYILNRALKKHGIDPKDVIYLSGNVKNLELAEQDRVGRIADSWGFDPLEHLQKSRPAYTIVKPGELLTVMTEQLVY